MRQHIFIILILIFIGISPFLAIADMTGPPPSFVTANPAAFSWIFGICLLAICTLLGLKLNADAKNNERMWHFISKNADDVTDLKIDMAKIITMCESRGNRTAKKTGRTIKKRGDGR